MPCGTSHSGPKAHNNLGNALQGIGSTTEAIRSYQRAAELRPDLADVHNNLGDALHSQGRLDEAVASYRQAVRWKPDFAEALRNLGVALGNQGKLDEAAASCRQALGVRPDYAEAHDSLGTILSEQGSLDQAADSHRRAIEIKPDFAEALNNLGSVPGKLGRPDEAAVYCRLALELKPNFAEALNNLGITLDKQGKFDDAIASYRQALRDRPDFAEAQWNLGLDLLLKGDFENGWDGYEWRWRCNEFLKRNPFPPGSRWEGEDIRGQTIFVHCEQGLGDTIQFSRYAGMIADRGGRVVLGCQPPLKSLLGRLDGIWEIAVTGVTPPYHYQIPLLSLPRVFKTTLATIPSKVPYLTPDEGLVRAWQAKLPPSAGRLRVGLVWAGGPGHANRNKSCSLKIFAPLATVPNVTFYSLQKGPAARESADPSAGMELLDLTDQLNDFADTAALIANLDLVISVDTAVAHLAGAMARPVWTLLSFAPDWRWLLDRPDSPWYPTMRLFRQPSIGNWEAVMEAVCRHLGEVVERRA